MLEIIENFLPIAQVKDLNKVVRSSYFPYFYEDEVSEERKETQFFFAHHLYIEGRKSSNFFGIADVIFNKIKTMPEFSQLNNHLYQLALHRAKVNCYPRQPENLKGFKHTDQEFKHVAALYSINTCNGGTIFHKEEPLFVPAKENTLIVFSGDIPHQPVFQTDTKLKLNVNFNLISGDISKKN